MTATDDGLAFVEGRVTRADLAEALGNLNAYTKRQMHHKDNPRYAEAHAKINRVLTAWERCES